MRSDEAPAGQAAASAGAEPAGGPAGQVTVTVGAGQATDSAAAGGGSAPPAEGGASAGPAVAGGAPPAAASGPRWRRAGEWLAGLPPLMARNPLFTLALALGGALRALVMIGYQPAALIRMDSYFYLFDTTRSIPDPDNTDGYPFFLWLIKPFHSLALASGLQHVMGLAIAVMVYALLRRYQVPRWAATLASLPTLLDPRELLVEHSIMSDTLATMLMVAAFAVLLARWPASGWRAAGAGLLLGLSVLVRPTALPLIVVVAVFLLITRAGWRRALAALAAAAVPLAGYAAWFYSAYGVIGLTNSNGLFLWARTTSFANCAVIKPPASLRPLCPAANPAKAHVPRPAPFNFHTLARQESPQDFLWSRRDWPWQPKPPGYELYQVAFTPAKNALAQKFALKAITAQPIDYAAVVGEGIALTFLHTDHAWRFPAGQPASPSQPTGTYRYEVQALTAYTGNTQGVAPYLGSHLGTRLERPYSSLVVTYERIVYLPGLLLAVVFLLGLVGLVARRTRTAAGMLLWVSAVITLVLPVALNQYNYRYALAAVPLACLAAAMTAAARRDAPRPARGVSDGQPQPAQSGPGRAG